MKIMHIWNGTVLFDAPDATSVQAAVLAAVKARANLSGADLSRAVLSGANLSGADLESP